MKVMVCSTSLLHVWGLPYSIDRSSGVNATLISSVKCTSNELSLKDCSIVKQVECMKYCEYFLGLQCYHPSNCSEGHVRLVDGDIEQEGRVEVCINGVWGSICDNGWGQTDAHIVCQQLGYASLAPISFHGDHFGPSNGPILYSNVDCGGWEESINECDKETHLKTLCSRDTVAGVMCSDDCSDGDVKLVGGVSPMMGTIEVCYDNLWGLINEDGWGLPDADVVCHQLGYDKASESTTGSQFGHPNKVIHIGDVGCVGTEQNFSECPFMRYSISLGRNLTASRDTIGIAGVVCRYEQDMNSSTSYISISTLVTRSVTPSLLPNNTSGGSKSSTSILIVLIAIAIVMIGFLAVGYILFKVLKRRKRAVSNRRHSPMRVAYNCSVPSNEYDSVADDTQQLISDLSSGDVDVKPSSDDREDEGNPVYEECGGGNKH